MPPKNKGKKPITDDREDKVRAKVPRKDKSRSKQTSMATESRPLQKYMYDQELQQFCTKPNQLGSGLSAEVYGATINDQQLAIKKFKKDKHAAYKVEMDYLSMHTHGRIVRLLGYSDDSEEKHCLIFEKLSSSLEAKYKTLHWNEVRRILEQIAEGIEYIHGDEKSIYADLKPANIMLDEECNVKIIDFGAITTSMSSHTTFTKEFAAPELFSKESGEFGQRSDVYSFGIVMLLMIMKEDIENILGRQNRRQAAVKKQIIIRAENFKKLKEGRGGGGKKGGGDALHKTLSQDCTQEAAQEITELALQCTNFRVDNRPHISEVLEKLKNLGSESNPTKAVK